MRTMLQGSPSDFLITSSNCYVKECLKPMINGCLVLLITWHHLISGQKPTRMFTPNSAHFKKGVCLKCRRANTTRLNKLQLPLGSFFISIFLFYFELIKL